MIILEENFKWHLEAFASELFIYRHTVHQVYMQCFIYIFISKWTELNTSRC